MESLYMLNIFRTNLKTIYNIENGIEYYISYYNDCILKQRVINKNIYGIVIIKK
jgi:hypothetical protein